MIKTKLLTLCTVSLALLSVNAHADSLTSQLDFSANVGFVSEYSFRGITQSDEGLAIQGGFDVAHETGLYAGIWGSNVDFNDGDEATIETDLYAGFASSFKGIAYDIGLIYYAYPGADEDLDYDFFELSAAAGYDFDVASASLSVNYSPDYFSGSGEAIYYAGALDVPLPYDLTLSAHAGYQAIDKEAVFGPDYWDWSLGLSYGFKGVDFGLHYIDTDLDEPNECFDGCSERIIGSISTSF